MTAIILPDVTGQQYESWCITPRWIRDGGTLHAVVWLTPDDETYDGNRHYVVGAHVHVHDGSDSACAAVACGSGSVGLLHDPCDTRYRMCSRCATVIRAMLGGIYRVWSRQLAKASRDELLRQLRAKDPNSMVAWAVEQVDDADPDRCLAQLDDIVRNKPPGDEQPQLMRCIIGGPDVLYDGEDAALRRIYQVSGDLVEARKIAGKKSAEARRQRRTEWLEERMRRQQKMFDEKGGAIGHSH